MVRQWQTLIYNGHYSQTTLDRGPDFVKLAEAYGLGGKRVCTVPELEDRGAGGSRQRPRLCHRLRH